MLLLRNISFFFLSFALLLGAAHPDTGTDMTDPTVGGRRRGDGAIRALKEQIWDRWKSDIWVLPSLLAGAVPLFVPCVFAHGLVSYVRGLCARLRVCLL